MSESLLSAEDKSVMEQIVAEFLRENAITNLSAIRTPEGVWEKHIGDSLAAQPFLQEYLRKKPSAKILDIGTGGGFPLLPLAAVNPNCAFFGLDSVGKKLAAIERIAHAVAVSNITLLHGRAEEYGRDEKYRERFDVVTARAVAPFPVLVELVSPFVTVGGIFVAYRGPESAGDDIALAAMLNLKFVQKHDYLLTTGEQRSLWIFLKQAKLSARFPRETGIPKRNPLTLADF